VKHVCCLYFIHQAARLAYT